jgi:hypothetical protein
MNANPPLIVYPDTVLTPPIPGQLFQPVPRRNSKIGQSIGGIEYEELFQCTAVDVPRELSRAFALEDPLGLWVVEAPNHSIIVTRRVNNVKRYVSLCALTVRIQRTEPGTGEGPLE